MLRITLIFSFQILTSIRICYAKFKQASSLLKLFTENIFTCTTLINQLLCGFSKAHSTQHALFDNSIEIVPVNRPFLKRAWLRAVYWYNSFNGIIERLWLFTSWFIDSIILGNKELTLVPFIVNGQKLDVEFLKGQYLVYFRLIYLLMIYSWLLNNQIFGIL